MAKARKVAMGKCSMFPNADDDTLTSQDSASSQHQTIQEEVQQAQQVIPVQDATHLRLTPKIWRHNDQVMPLSWREGDSQQPQIALDQAKQEFAHWLSGAHAHPDYVDHMQQQANSQEAAKPHADQEEADDTSHVVTQLQQQAGEVGSMVKAFQGDQDGNGVGIRKLIRPTQQQAVASIRTAGDIYKGYQQAGDVVSIIDYLQQQAIANSNMPAKTYVGYKDNNGFGYAVDQASMKEGKLQHASLGS